MIRDEYGYEYDDDLLDDWCDCEFCDGPTLDLWEG